MQQPNDMHHAFAAALWGRSAPPPAINPQHRLSIYRNNVHTSLIGVLRARFPVVLRLVGDECFSACAQRFIVANPPISPVLLEYGGAFPDFLGAQDELQSLFYLRDVARLEWAMHNALYAADADYLDPAALAALPPDELPGVVLAPHPSLRLVRSPYPIETIWRTNRFDEETQLIPADLAGENVLIARFGMSVAATIVSPDQVDCVWAILSGQTLGEAAEIGADLSPVLAVLFRAGALSSFHCNPN